MPLASNVPPWPEWTAITTEWNGPYDDPEHPDPDEYTATCYRCQDAHRTPYTFDGTLNDCIQWAYQHATDPDPTPPKPPVRPRPKGA